MKTLNNCKKLLIEVNQTCNLNCTYCFYRDYGRVSNSLSIENIEEMLEKCPNVDEFFLTGGECFTSKNIDQIIDKLSDKGYLTIFTNGVKLNDYDDKHLLETVNKVDRFIISFDHYDYENCVCRKFLNKTLSVIKRILEIDKERLEVKVCISKFNDKDLEDIFKYLIDLGVKYLSINFIFDIKNTPYKHEIKNKKELKSIFKIIDKYISYFNEPYIEVLRDLYLNDKTTSKYPCLADNKYFYLDCCDKYYICPGNCKKIGDRGDYKKCFSKECINEWEIMYRR